MPEEPDLPFVGAQAGQVSITEFDSQGLLQLLMAFLHPLQLPHEMCIHISCSHISSACSPKQALEITRIWRVFMPSVSNAWPL